MDPDGESGALGAIIGAVSEGLTEAVSQLADGGITDLGAIGEAALEGAILGAVPVVGVTGKFAKVLNATNKLKTKPKAGDGANSAGKKIPNCDLCGAPNKRGNAPIGNDGHPVELHHRNQKPDGPLDEMTRTDHRLGDNFKKNHSNTGQDPSQIDRKAWREEQRDYWKQEWDSGRFDDM